LLESRKGETSSSGWKQKDSSCKVSRLSRTGGLPGNPAVLVCASVSWTAQGQRPWTSGQWMVLRLIARAPSGA
jgi:hypothetical protein